MNAGKAAFQGMFYSLIDIQDKITCPTRNSRIDLSMF